MPRQRRSSLRLQGYDYTSTGVYFVTICTHQREMLFEGQRLHSLAEEIWCSLPKRFPTIRLDESVVMPNHFHAVVWLNNQLRSEACPALSAVIGSFKSLVAVRWLEWIRDHQPERSGRIWQRGYYDRIVRNERELNAIRQYVRDNPRRWAEDRDNLDSLLKRMQAHL